jgi:hypothetical protein
MERSGNSVTGASHHPDLAELMRRDGPFVTVWARDESALANLSGGSAGAEAVPTEVVEQLADAVRQRFPRAGGVVGIADNSGLLLVEDLPEPPRRDLVRFAPLPSVSPLIEHRQSAIPYVFVIVDRRGADVNWSSAQGAGSTTVEAPDGMLIEKFKDSDSGSGYRQHDFQQKAENNWKRIASDIAAVLTDVVGNVRPEVITVAGDVRMIQLLRDELPADTAALLREVPGSRSEDGSGPLREDAVRRWVRTAVAQDTVEVLKVFERERGQHDRAADGAEATLAALREARVDVLLTHDDPDDERCGWYAREDPSVVALDETVVASLGYEPRQAPLVDVALRAALATGAGVRVVPSAGPVHESLGAILRW